MFDTFKHRDLGLLLLRLGVGVVFINHGLMKYNAIGSTIRFFESLNLPAFMAYFVTGVELAAGILLILGLFIEIAGVALAIDMAVAMAITPWTRGFTGHELEFLLLIMALALALSGAGRYAVPLKKSSPGLP